MEKFIPEDIIEARKLLETSLRMNDHDKRVNYFDSAIELSNDYLELNPHSHHKIYIENIKMTYLRSLIKNLPTNNVDIKIWFNYTALFMRKYPLEFNTIIENDPTLKKIYNEFDAHYLEMKEFFFEA
ncbi:MAG: hypothetical protein KJ822_18925 [Proteobacteria bacterium]|nr:hypothetical protein [Pseudomonadota bacterium]MBU4357396.1 hypothetical protein [Pseudomonadota bacterium]